MSVGHWIGRQIANVHDFFRSLTPCSVDWEYREDLPELKGQKLFPTVEIGGVVHPIRFADYVCGIDGPCTCEHGGEFTTDTLAEWKLNRLPNE